MRTGHKSFFFLFLLLFMVLEQLMTFCSVGDDVLAVHNSNGPRWTRTMWNKIWKPPTIDTSEYIAVRRSIFLLSSETCGILYRSSIYCLYIVAVSIFSGKEMRATVLLRTFDLPLLAFRCFLFHLVCFFQLSIRGAEKRRERSRMKNIEERKEKGTTLYIYNII